MYSIRQSNHAYQYIREHELLVWTLVASYNVMHKILPIFCQFYFYYPLKSSENQKWFLESSWTYYTTYWCFHEILKRNTGQKCTRYSVYQLHAWQSTIPDVISSGEELINQFLRQVLEDSGIFEEKDRAPWTDKSFTPVTSRLQCLQFTILDTLTKRKYRKYRKYKRCGIPGFISLDTLVSTKWVSYLKYKLYIIFF